MKPRHILVYLAVKHGGSWEETYQAIKDKEPITPQEVEMVASAFNEKDYITIVDKDYPEELKSVNRPPIVLFKKRNKTTQKPPVTLEELTMA